MTDELRRFCQARSEIIRVPMASNVRISISTSTSWPRSRETAGGRKAVSPACSRFEAAMPRKQPEAAVSAPRSGKASTTEAKARKKDAKSRPEKARQVQVKITYRRSSRWGEGQD